MKASDCIYLVQTNHFSLFAHCNAKYVYAIVINLLPSKFYRTSKYVYAIVINLHIILLLGALAARKYPDRIRGRSAGRELDRLSRGLCMKLPIHISEGNRRPEAPIQAAKLASEGGITLRQHIPILTHWKEYKKNESHLENYIGKIGVS